MSAFSGARQGTMRDHRARKRAEAEERNAKTPQGRRRAYRREQRDIDETAEQLLRDVFTGEPADG